MNQGRSDRLAVLSANAAPIAKRILDSYRATEHSRITDHFNHWVGQHIESPETPPLSPVERRMLFFRVTHAADNRPRVIPGRNGRPDRWTGIAEHAVAAPEPVQRAIHVDADEPGDAQ